MSTPPRVAALPTVADWRALRSVLARAIHTTTAVADFTLPPGAAWERMALAAREGEVPILAARAHPELARHLAASVRRQALIDMHLAMASERVALALAPLTTAGRRPVLLKGSATAHVLYATPLERLRRDIDLLVPADDYFTARELLLAAGFRDDVNPSRAARGPHDSAAWPLALDTALGVVACDLHRRLVASARYTPDEAGLIARAAPLDGTPFATPTREDLVLHGVVHLAVNGVTEPLKSWVDLALLAAGPLDVEVLLARARAWGAAQALTATAQVLARWFDVALPHPPATARTALVAHLLSGDGGTPLHRLGSKRAAARTFAVLLVDRPHAALTWLGERLSARLQGLRAPRR